MYVEMGRKVKGVGGEREKREEEGRTKGMAGRKGGENEGRKKGTGSVTK